MPTQVGFITFYVKFLLVIVYFLDNVEIVCKMLMFY